MANAYSIARQYNEYISPIDVNFLNTTLQTLDKKYDANMAKVDALVETYTKMPLLREEDKKILYQNILSLESEINSHSKMQLTSNDTLRSIQNSLQSAITPYIAEQFGIAQRVNAFNSEIAKKREKNPELYDDRNYQFALENAGLEDYSRGYDKNGNKVDKIGNLVYQDYYDIEENLTKPLMDFAKSIGAENYSQVLEGDYTNKILSGERFTVDKITSFVQNKLATDPKLQAQIQINARANFKGLDDSTFSKNYLDSVVSNKKLLDTAIMEIDERLKQLDPKSQEYAQYTADKQSIENRKTDLQSFIDNPNSKSRNVLEQELYTNSLLQSYAETFAYDNIEKINYDDTPLKILKFQTQKAQKERELDIKEFGTSGGSDANNPFAVPSVSGVGTPYDIAPNTKEEERTNAEIVQDVWEDAKDNFSQLMTSIDPSFSSMTEEEKTNQLVAIAKNASNLSMTENPYPKEVIEAAIAFNTANETNLAYRREINARWVPKVEETYRLMYQGRNADLNIDNLASTAPNVASFLRQGIALGNLTGSQRKIMIAELSRNMAEYSEGGNSDDIAELKTVNFNFEKDLKGDELENYNKGLNRTTITLGDSPGSIWGGVKEGASFVGNSILGRIAPVISGMAQGDGAYFKAQTEYAQAANQNLENLSKYVRRYAASQISPFQSDRNVSELQARDLGSDRGYLDYFKSWSDEAKIQRQMSDTKYIPTFGQQKGISFNKEDKVQKNYAIAIENVFQSKGYRVAKDSNYRAERDGDEYVLEATTESYVLNEKGRTSKVVDTKPTLIRVNANEMPPALIQAIGLQDNWTTSSFNANVRPTTIKYTLAKNEAERNDNFNKFMSGLGSGFTPQQEETAYKEGFMPTATSIIQPYVDKLDTPEKQEIAINLMNAQFEGVVIPVRGQGYKVVLNMDGEQADDKMVSPIIRTYDTVVFATYTDRLVKAFLDKSLATITNIQ